MYPIGEDYEYVKQLYSHISDATLEECALAAKEAEMMGGIVIGGTDFHYPCDTALCITCFKELPKDSFELAAAIKQKDYIIKLSGGVILPYANRK